MATTEHALFSNGQEESSLTMDMSTSIEARSDQINAADLAAPRTYTIEKVTKGNATAPFDFHLVESPGKAYRPNLSMRRVIVQAWGPETSEYEGRRLTLFNEPTVVWAGAEVGGIRISHMSHLDKPLKTALAISQKKKVPYTVEPLEDAPTNAGPSVAQINASTDVAELKAMWKATTDKSLHKLIEGRVAELSLPASSADVDTNPELTL